MLAPNQVSAPAAIQTRSMPAKVGTALLTSDGCTKIDAPTIVPTTMAVACVSPIVRASLDVIPIGCLPPKLARTCPASGGGEARAPSTPLLEREGFSRAGCYHRTGGGWPVVCW